MKNKICISVIIAVYNAQKYLPQCLDSIVNQTYENLEIICVNDGSSDSSLEILESYALKDKRIQIVTKENEGLGGASARNLGLDMAKGHYVSILDSDDFYELDMYEKVVSKAESTGADIVVFGGNEYDDASGNFNKVDSILNSKVIPNLEVFSYQDCSDTIYQLSQGMAWCKLFKKDFLKRHGIKFQRIKYTDDAYFTFANMALADKIAVVDECLCHYRVNSGTSQTDGLANYPDSAYEPYLALKNSLEEWGIYEKLRKSFINCAVTFIRYFYDRIDKYSSFKYLHEKLVDEVFPKLGVIGLNKDYFYDERVFLWLTQVINNSPEELLFEVAKKSGNSQTTSILRFRFPYEKIPKGSKIAVIGAGIMGRHYCSQVILSGEFDIVIWAEQNNPGNYSYISLFEDLKSVDFDYAIIAYTKSDLINNVLDVLTKIGIDKSRIVIGGI